MRSGETEEAGRFVEARAFLHLAAVAGGVGPWRIALDELVPPTVGAAADRLGIECGSIGMVMVNGHQAEVATALQPGDRVAFFPTYVPYHRVYGMCVV